MNSNEPTLTQIEGRIKIRSFSSAAGIEYVYLLIPENAEELGIDAIYLFPNMVQKLERAIRDTDIAFLENGLVVTAEYHHSENPRNPWKLRNVLSVSFPPEVGVKRISFEVAVVRIEDDAPQVAFVRPTDESTANLPDIMLTERILTRAELRFDQLSVGQKLNVEAIKYSDRGLAVYELAPEIGQAMTAAAEQVTAFAIKQSPSF